MWSKIGFAFEGFTLSANLPDNILGGIVSGNWMHLSVPVPPTAAAGDRGAAFPKTNLARFRVVSHDDLACKLLAGAPLLLHLRGKSCQIFMSLRYDICQYSILGDNPSGLCQAHPFASAAHRQALPAHQKGVS